MDVEIGKRAIKSGRIKKMILLCGAILLIIFVQLRHLDQLFAPWVNDDETGYWGTAAYFAGYDWSEILKHGSYYSYGYGLVLAPLFFFFKSPITLYRAAIVLNVIFLVIVFVVAYNIIRMLYGTINQYMAISIALVATLTSGAMTYGEIAWSETLILLLTWLTFFFFIRYLLSSKDVCLVLFVLCNVFAYIVHQRMLGLVIASVIMLGFCAVKKTIPLSRLVGVVIILGIGFAVSVLGKNNIQQTLWNSANMADVISVNDYSGQIGKITAILSSGSDFFLFVVSVFGKIFYFESATLFLLFPAGYFLIKKLKERKLEVEGITFLFMFLTVLGMLAVNSIFMYVIARNDCIIYGRYAETLVGVLILMTICNWLNREFGKKAIMVGGITLIGVGISVYIIYVLKQQIWDIDLGIFSLNISFLTRYIVDREFYIMKYVKESFIIVGLLLVIVALYHYNKKCCRQIAAILSLSFIILSFKNANQIFDIYTEPWQQQKKSIIELIDENKVLIDSKETVHFLFQNEFNSDANRNVIQFVLRDKQVICHDIYSDVELEKGELLFVNTTNSQISEVEEECELIQKNDLMAIFQIK